MQFPHSELVLNDKNQVYHLGLSPEDIAENIILVGDQDRVEMISSFFSTIDHKSRHREFVCHTGSFNGKRISAISTGIGTDNIDITVNELDALVNIDLKKRIEKEEKTSLNLVRIGTCGILQSEIPVHSYILSSHALGLDNIAHFYDILFSSEEQSITDAFIKHVELSKFIQPYTIKSSDDLTRSLWTENVVSGITVTSSGFYGPQGRQLRFKNTIEDFNEKLEAFRFENYKITNFEMESSALFALGKGLGHNCATICLGIANRPNMQFSKGYRNEMLELIKHVLDRI